MSKASSPVATGTGTAGRRVRYAVVGLGHIAQTAVLPAIAHARNSVVSALVSDDPGKLASIGSAYGAARGYFYTNYDACLTSGEVDAVYIALPTDQHAEFAIRAARAGVHVLCEQPMAVSAGECRRMIEAAETNGVDLMIAYRLHFQRATRDALRTAASGRLGDLRFFNSTFSRQVAAQDIRTRMLAVGGGTVYDLGISCINTARSLFRAEPTEVTALSARNHADPRFAQIDEMTGAVLRFPGERLATFISGFGAAATSAYELVGALGSMRIDNAYGHTGRMTRTLTIDGHEARRTFPAADLSAGGVDYFSDCIITGKVPEPSGEEGLADVRIIEAIHESARSGRPTKIAWDGQAVARPTADQEVAHPDPPRPAHALMAKSPKAH